ncbi:MAG: hypothetical protein ABMA64_06320 [Myxococcota bacterium]
MLVWWMTAAMAQSPLTAPLNVPLGAAGPSARFVAAEVVSERFPGETAPGPTFTAGEQVEVLIEENGKVRIRSGEKYGWVAVAALGAAPPATAVDPNLLGGLQPLLPPGTAPATP